MKPAMIFGRRQKYKLPKFPGDVAATFKSYCESVPADAIPGLLEELEQCVAKIAEMAETNQRIDMGLVHKLADVSRHLLSNYENYSLGERILVIGAVRYFAVLDDSLPDDGFSSGLDDDIQVMNHVLEQIGEEDLFIT